jgi:hypothetical protein
VYAAFLQNAPVVRHTRGFTPGWYAVPRWGTPNGLTPPSTRPPSPSATQPHPCTKPQQRNQPENPLNPALTPRAPPAAAGPGRSELRNVDILIPLARPRESVAGPNVPCERRTDPAEPPRAPGPLRSPAAPHGVRPSVPSLPTTSFRPQFNKVSIRTSTCIVRSVRPL